MRSNRGGCLIAFEGIEGAGKSTQLRLIADVLHRDGWEVLLTAEPGGTALGAGIRRLVMEQRDAVPTPAAELLLYLADRAQHVAEVIRPAIDRGAIVLTDRFSGSTIAYQGYARGLDLEFVIAADAWARAGVCPHLTVLLDCPVRIGLPRAQGADRFHAEVEDFHDRVRQGFLNLAAADPAHWRVVDAARPAPDVHEQIVGVVRAALPSP